MVEEPRLATVSHEDAEFGIGLIAGALLTGRLFELTDEELEDYIRYIEEG